MMIKLFLPVLFFSIFTFSQEPQLVKKAEVFEKTKEIDTISLQIVDNPTVFKGCEEGTVQDKKNCIYKKLMAIFDEKYKHPKASEKIIPRFFLSFIIDKKGNTKLHKIRYCQDKLIEDEIKRIYKKIPKAIPGTYNKKKINVLIGNMPIVIKIEDL